MKKYIHLLLIILLGAFLVFWTGCGSSRKTMNEGDSSTSGQTSQDDYDEIEKLLGISRDDKKSEQPAQKPAEKSTSQTKSNDDLITLLEVNEGKQKETPAETGTSTEDKRVARLQADVESLRKDLKKKDMEIADLKTQLMLAQESAKKQPATQTQSAAGYYQQPATPSSQPSTQPVSSSDYGYRYQEALDTYHQHEYQQALNQFEQLLASDMNNDLSDNAQYWIGECYYAMGRYQEAIMAFEKVFTFRYSNKNDYAQFKIGQSYFKLGDKERANQEFQQLIDTYPDSELVPRARDYLAKF